MALLTVPVIDLTHYRDGTDKLAVARAVDRACREIGFPVINGHGVPVELVERTRAAGRTFFDLPLAEKRRVARPAATVARGYTGHRGPLIHWQRYQPRRA